MSKPETMSDDDLVGRLSGNAGEIPRQEALRQIFLDQDLRTIVLSQILKNGGTKEDAKEVFQEAVLQLERAIRENRFERKSTVRTFFASIAKWHWVNMRRKQNRQVEWNPETYQAGSVESVDVRVYDQEARHCLDSAIDTLGRRCKDLLRYWSMSYAPEELCDLFGFSSPEMAKKESYRCRTKLKAYFDANPQHRETLNYR